MRSDLRQFLAQRPPSTAARVRSLDLYEEYVAWVEAAGADPITHAAFGRALGAEVSRGRGRSGVYYLEYELKRVNGE